MQLAAVAAGFLAALLVIRLWVAPPPVWFTAAERLYVIGRSGRICALTAVVPLIAGLIAMWHAPYGAAVCFAASSCGFTLAGWFAGQRRRARRV